MEGEDNSRTCMEIEKRSGDGIDGEMIVETDDTQIVGVSRMITFDSIVGSGKVVTVAVVPEAKAEVKVGKVEIENRSGDGIDSQLVRVSPMVTLDSISGKGEVVTAAVHTEVKAEVKVDGVNAEVKVDESSGTKRKRGRPSTGQPRPPPMKKMKDEEEDVCFICFDGGSLVLCDRRGCPKAYHPACIKRDEAFFSSKAKWNCGWHICSFCQKAAHYMCYTCTYSLCKACIREADYVCVRDNKGFCTICMRTIMLIEDNDQGNKEMPRVDFDDKSSWEYLFKIYWIYLKEKLSLTLHELTQAKNPWKAASIVACKLSLNIHYGVNDSKGSVFISPVGHPESNDSKRAAEQSKLPNNGATLTTDKSTCDKDTTSNEPIDWASKDLLEFISHMKNGDTSVLSMFDVQSLLLDYIKRNNLRDPSRKSQIICDLRLKNLFGKHRVGHFEMLKLVEFHFHTKYIRKDVIEDNIIDAGLSQVEFGGNNANPLMMRKDKKRKNRTRGEGRGPQINSDEYAAINVHNINLIYLRRNLMESLVVDSEKFNETVVGSIVRIRISNNDQKQDMYRLVQVVGTSKAAVPYKIGEKTADAVLEIFNLDKKETISIDAISNQALSEDECRRLRQSIKCGLVKRLTIGQVQKKAAALQEVRLGDWLETEVLRLNHLRDRASEKGHKKGLRECIEKLELLKTPEERQRRLHEIPEVHADPNMDPNCDSDEAAGEVDNKKQGEHVKPRFSGLDKKRRVSISAKKCDNENICGIRAWKGLNTCGKSRILSTRFYFENGTAKKPDNEVDSCCSVHVPETSISSADDSETEKLWHYRDPNGKIQGPFCMFELRKWSTTGYFPPEMRIWSTNNKELDSFLLTDVLNGKFHKVFPLWSNISFPSQGVTSSGSRLDYCDYRSSSSSMNITGIDDGHTGISLSSLHQGKGHEGKRGSSALNNGNWSSEQKFEIDIQNLPKISNDNLGQAVKAPVSLPVQVFGLHKLPSTTPELSCGDEKADSNIQNLPLDGNMKIESSEDKLSDSSKFPVQYSCSSWSTSERQCDKTADEEGDSGLGSVTWLKPISDHAATPTSKCDQINTPSPKCDQFTPPTPSDERRCDESGGCSSTHSKPSVVKHPELANEYDQLNTHSPSGKRQCHQTANEWVGCSPTRAKLSIEEGNSGHGSVTSFKLPHDHAAIQTPPSRKCDQLNTPPSYPESTWHIEFSTLDEESVSDLLAEVDAMESQCGLASSSSAMYSDDELFEDTKNDWFNSLGVLIDSGTMSSTGDILVPHQSTRTDEQTLVPSQSHVLHLVNRYTVQ